MDFSCRVRKGDLDGTDVRSEHTDTDNQDGRLTLSGSITHTTAQLRSITRDRPHDVGGWLAYAAHQAYAMAASGA